MKEIFKVFLLVGCIVSLCGCGCSKQSSEMRMGKDSSSHDNSPEVVAVKDRMSIIKAESDDGSHKFGSWREISEFNALINGVPDVECRRRLVEEYGQMLLSIEMAHPPYQRWENAGRGYFSHLDNVIQLMQECDLV